MLGSRSRLLNFDLSTTIPICASFPSILGLDSLIRFRTSAAVATPVRLSLKRASRNFRTGCIYVLSLFAPISTFSISCLCKDVLAQSCKTESLGFQNAVFWTGSLLGRQRTCSHANRAARHLHARVHVRARPLWARYSGSTPRARPVRSSRGVRG